MGTHLREPRQSRLPLLGGIGLLPFAAYLFLSAWAFERGYLHWETNHGPPYLGYLAGLGLCKLVQRYYYRRVLRFSFVADQRADQEGAKNEGIPAALGILLLVLLLGAWYVDANYALRVRFLPLVGGVALLWYAFAHLRHTWEALFWGYWLAGLTLVGYSVLPLWLGPSWGWRYFGLEGICELLAGAIAVTIIAVAEHQTILRIVELAPQGDGLR
jgi:hypothetical protein